MRNKENLVERLIKAAMSLENFYRACSTARQCGDKEWLASHDEYPIPNGSNRRTVRLERLIKIATTAQLREARERTNAHIPWRHDEKPYNLNPYAEYDAEMALLNQQSQ